MKLGALSQRRTGMEEGFVDVRGWKVLASPDGREIGAVEDILVDERGEPRYLDVELSERGENVLLPPGHAEVDPAREAILLDGITPDAVARVPAWDRDPASLDQDYETRVGTAWDGAYDDRRFHARPDYRGSWGAGNGENASGRLGRLDRMDDYEVADHDHDPRGWTVVGGDGETLGEVDHLIGDTGSMKVRYLVLELDDEVGHDAPHVLVPAGHAALEPERERVLVTALDRKRVRELPGYREGKLDREHEMEVGRVCASGYQGERRYRHPRFRSSQQIR